MAPIALLAILPVGTPAYTEMKLLGWPVRVETPLVRDQPEKWNAVRREIENQFYRIERALPAEALAKVRKVTLWVHTTSPETACMAYHPGAQWLRDHKMNPEMEGGIEIGNVDNFLKWTHEQPWMLLHELAHAYHSQFLDQKWKNPELESAFKAAMAAKRYDDVLHWSGKRMKHYACNNPMEFFAEASEAYFGQNDFYPFVNAELKTHDPATHALIAKLWGVR